MAMSSEALMLLIGLFAFIVVMCVGYIAHRQNSSSKSDQ